MEENQGRENQHQQPTLPNNAPHFFNVIFDGKRMGIPKKFVRKYGENISGSESTTTVLLKVPTGETQWPVELGKDDDGQFRLFEKGWKEFCDHFSLSHGNFLLFRHECNSTFHVIIFDTTASEIAYPLDQSAESDDDDDVSVSVEFLGESYTELSQDESHDSGRGRSRALERAEAMQMTTKNPSSIVIMHPYYINHPGYRMSMKAEFLKYFKYKRETVRLYAPGDGRAWTVKQSGYRLCSGWRKFVQENGLEVGDVCLFEMINGGFNSLKVIIFRAAED